MNTPRPWLREFNLPKLGQPRPIVIRVDAGSEAARSGLAPGDVVLDVNRNPVAHAKEAIHSLKQGTLNIMAGA